MQQVSHVRNLRVRAYSGRAIRDAARTTIQRRSPPGAGMEETDALVSRGIGVNWRKRVGLRQVRWDRVPGEFGVTLFNLGCWDRAT